MLDSWSVYLTLYWMTPRWTRDLCIWHYTEWLHVGLVICVSDIIENDDGLVICVSAIIQNDNMLDSWSVYLTLYRMASCWTRDLMLSFCIMADTQITSPHEAILYNVRYTDHESNIILYNVRYIGHESNIASSCIMSDTDHESKCIRHYTEWCWTRDLCIWHYTEWIHVGHVICVSDIIQNGFMLALWSCIWHYTEWCHVGLMICLSNIIQNDATLDSWSVYLTLYRMTPHWTRDLCIWHYTGWRNVGLVILWRHPV